MPKLFGLLYLMTMMTRVR